jgi:ubiquinone biosynthesis monooxygenase Coq7
VANGARLYNVAMLAARSWSDRLIATVDQALRTLAAAPLAARSSPADVIAEPAPLHPAERRRSAALLRVNHAGELAAQALYDGQALLARSESTRRQLLAAAGEERDHLAWCAQRLRDLGGRRSVLDPFWYAGSFCIGLAAAACGDRVSLGFVTETERQVETHLRDHLGRLPPDDRKSAAVLTQMAADETHHGTMAALAGGAELPAPIRRCMAIGGGILRRVAMIL